MAALGQALSPDVLQAVRALYDAEQRQLAEAVPVAAADLAYGPDARHRLDIYGGAAHELRPVLVFVHGGGFLKGDKGGVDNWQNANVGRMAAALGFVGVVINYRLAPDHGWPAGAEDVAAVVAWLRENAAQHGGDAARIVLLGTSAGAVHVAGYLKAAGDKAPGAIRGAVLLSGLYGTTPLDERDVLYYGDPALYAARMPREAVVATTLPLLIACAEFDPPRFQREFLDLLRDRLALHGTMPRGVILSGHNHYSMAMHLGTADRRLADEIGAFVRECCA
ncbi:alpha/beta hydrolase [Novosphingobium lentum]|uniref:alpha/beta hydrolase n=1 Tax=Novosphingobium lentum TaxID=145287 RepID=UPI001FDECCDA|nr:alpha/beta hydrolase [Novosphingobium lentum]